MAKQGGAAKSFPSAGVDRIKHELQVNMYSKRQKKVLESLLFEGTMTIQRSDPTVETTGKRKIPFIVKSWTASAFSQVLGKEIMYVISPSVQQPESKIVSDKKGQDYPASFFFNLFFDAIVDGQIVKQKHMGRPWAHGFLEVPPSGDRKKSPTIRNFEKLSSASTILSWEGLSFIR